MRFTLFTVLLVTGLHPAVPTTDEPRVPFRLHRDHLVLVQGGTGRFSGLVLLLDTGTARTIVTKAVVSSLGLKGTSNHLHAFGQPISAEEVVLPDLSIGGRLIAQPSVLVTDLSGTAASLQLPQLDAIIGMDILGRESFSIDFSGKALQFGAPIAVPHRIPFVRNQVLPVIRVAVDGTPVHLIVDTGASHVALFGFAGGRPLVLKEDAVQLGGKATVKAVLLEYLQIGSWRKAHVVALVMDRTAVESTGADGVLGLPALGASVVQFDFNSDELGWKP